MIIRERPSGLKLFFIVKGSIVPRIKWPLVVTVFLACIVTFTHGTLFRLKIVMTPIPFSLIGLALAIFIGFRNSASYDRYWEGRKLWGELIVQRHRTAYLYCFLLPFGLVDSIGFMTPFVVGIVSFTFFGLDALGDEIEEPFGVLPNDLALSSMCRTIERDLRAALGETSLPEPLLPVGYRIL